MSWMPKFWLFPRNLAYFPHRSHLDSKKRQWDLSGTAWCDLAVPLGGRARGAERSRGVPVPPQSSGCHPLLSAAAAGWTHSLGSFTNANARLPVPGVLMALGGGTAHVRPLSPELASEANTQPRPRTLSGRHRMPERRRKTSPPQALQGVPVVSPQAYSIPALGRESQSESTRGDRRELRACWHCDVGRGHL